MVLLEAPITAAPIACSGFAVALVARLAQQPGSRSTGDRFGLAPARVVVALEVWSESWLLEITAAL
jgi:hypothetical protein